MLRHTSIVLLLNLLMLLACPAEAGGESGNTAMIATCVYHDYRLPEYDPVDIWLFGGIIADKGWVSDIFAWAESRDGPWKIAGTVTAKGDVEVLIDPEHFMREGERVSVYDLEAGVLGEAILNTGAGGRFGARPIVAPGQEVRFKRVNRLSYLGPDPMMLAVWHQDGGRPGWVTGKVLDPESAVYRPLVAAWLTERGVSPSVADGVVITQIVRVDINGDDRHEVFLSFHSPEAPDAAADEKSSQAFSYLVMRTIAESTGQVTTVVVDDSQDRAHKIRGFCDLDRDGVTEVATQYQWGMTLFRFEDGAFSQMADQEFQGGC